MPTYVCLLDRHGCRVERRPGNTQSRSSSTKYRYGPRVPFAEREALAYATTLDLPVPRLHDVPAPEETEKTDAGGGDGDGGSIWMDHIDGAVLEDVRPDMTTEQKMGDACQLREILDAGAAAAAAALEAAPRASSSRTATSGSATWSSTRRTEAVASARCSIGNMLDGTQRTGSVSSSFDTHPKKQGLEALCAVYILPGRNLDELVVYQALKRWQVA